jgi:hypothetical protein
VHKFSIQPILHPSGVLIVIIDVALAFFKQGIVHVAFSRRNNQFELLINEVVAPLVGIVTVNVAVEVLSEPKSNTAIALSPLLEL